MKLKSTLSVIVFLATATYGQSLSNQVNIGGSGDDFHAITPINDGSGYYLFGSSNSNISGNKTEDSKGFDDYWLIKTDNNFSIEWDKTIGGSASDRITGALASDNGIFVVGYSFSDISGDKTMDSYGSADIWLLYISENGTIVWQEQYGGDQYESSTRIINYTDTSLLILGMSESGISGNKTVASIGYNDIWLLEISKQDGAIIQQKVIGTENSDVGNVLARNPHNNHIYIGAQAVVGVSGDKSEYGYGSFDAWIIELDENLNIINEKVYGGSLTENPISSFIFTENCIYAITTSTSDISGNKSTPSFGTSIREDLWVLKLNYDLSIVWDKSYGGSREEYSNTILELSTGNILITSSSRSESGTGNKTSINQGLNQFDVWIVVIQPDGEIVYQENFGGAMDDFIDNVIVGNGNELIFSSFSNSTISGNKTVPTWGGIDTWLGKIDLETVLSISNLINEHFELFPNPATNELFVNGNVSATSYKIIDMSGKTVISESIQGDQVKINVAPLQTGMYLLQIDERQFKFIKQ